ncbi:MAG: sugar phosphate isomerase/epimerase [Opitutaceae bacterium]|nr:sugar phosphate isomerase/epimerase [Opitutaceae bacterium]
MIYPAIFRSALLAVVVSALSLTSAAHAARAARNKGGDGGPKLGLQTWTCRNMTFDQVVDFAVKHGVTQIEFIKAHLDPTGPKEESLRKKAILDQKGLVAYSFGVNQTSMDKEANRKLFEFAKLMGMKVIIVEPKNMAEWDNLEELVKEYDIKLAIHNHGTGTAYGDPATVKKVLASRDRRIGVCLDIGWVTAAGFDAAKVFREYGSDRVYDMHFKDKTTQPDAKGKAAAVDTEIGKGKSNYTGLFAEIKKSGWSGVMAIETDSKAFAEDPNRLVSEAKNFFASQVK